MMNDSVIKDKTELYFLAKKIKDLAPELDRLTEEEKQVVIEIADKEETKLYSYFTFITIDDSLDWKELGVEPVVDRVTRNVENGSIVLFHNNAKYILDFLPLPDLPSNI